MTDNIIIVKQAPFMTVEQLPPKCVRIATRMAYLTSAGQVVHTMHTRDENQNQHRKIFMWLMREDSYSPAHETFCLTIGDVSYRRVKIDEMAMCIEYHILANFLRYEEALSKRLKLHNRMMASGLFGSTEVKQWQAQDVTA